MNMISIAWAAAAVLLGILEGITAGLFVIWFAVGALAAFIISLFDVSLPVQLLVFLVVSIAALIATRPFVKKVLKVRQVPTNADSLVGKMAVVTEEVDPIAGSGRAKVEGLNWMAVCPSGEVIPVGTVVKVLRIEGAKLLIERQEAVTEA